MLAFLPTVGMASERKLRLLAVALCRFAWRTVDVRPLARQAVDVAERFADAGASLVEMESSRKYAISAAEHACMNAAEPEANWVMADCAALNAA
jgi:hypothetical protein